MNLFVRDKVINFNFKDTNERTQEEMEAEFNINFEVADLSTIHEAYQFLFKKYVCDAEKVKNENFLTPEEIMKNHEKRQKKKKAKESKNMDIEEITDMKKKSRRAR